MIFILNGHQISQNRSHRVHSFFPWTKERGDRNHKVGFEEPQMPILIRESITLHKIGSLELWWNGPRGADVLAVGKAPCTEWEGLNIWMSLWEKDHRQELHPSMMTGNRLEETHPVSFILNFMQWKEDTVCYLIRMPSSSSGQMQEHSMRRVKDTQKCTALKQMRLDSNQTLLFTNCGIGHLLTA